MADTFRALCAELMKALDEAAPGINQFRDLRDRADAALADEPAVPQGREPGATNLEKEFRSWWKETHGSPYFGAVPLEAVLSWTEYALARWGNPAPAPPADGEAAELVAWLREKAEILRHINCDDLFGCCDVAARLTRAAELLQRQALVPVSERLPASEWPPVIPRTGKLLQRQALVPVAVSERLPGPGDCDAEGRCWAWRGFDPDNDDDGEFWQLIHAEWLSAQLGGGWTHWLPAHALPLPEASE